MSKSQVQRGNILDLTAPVGGVVSGSAYLTGAILGVAQTTAAVGEMYAASVCGVHSLPKEATTAAFTEGEIVYWDNTNFRFDESASGRYPAGVAVKAAIASDAYVSVRLDGVSLVAVP